jgi:hypothetical protein
MVQTEPLTSDLDKCLSVQSAVCQANHQLNSLNVDINSNFNILPNFNIKSDEGDNLKAQAEVVDEVCGEYDTWMRETKCKGQTGRAFEDCLNNQQVEEFVKLHPDSILAAAVEGEKDASARGLATGSNIEISSDSNVGVVNNSIFSEDGSYVGSELNPDVSEYQAAEVDAAQTLPQQQQNKVTKQQPQVMDFKPYVVRAQAEAGMKKSEADLKRIDEQMRSETDPAKRSELDKERARLEAEIAAFKAQIEESNKQIADMRREFENRPQTSGTPEKKRQVSSNGDDDEVTTTTKRRPRSTGSAGGGVVVSGDERGGSTAGSGVGGSTAGSTGGSVGAGGSSSGPISSVKAAQQALASNDALLETVNGKAAQLTLTVDGQTVNVQQILSLTVPADASPEDVKKLMVADPSKLVFNGDGYALVEVTRPGQPPAYFKVKKGDLTAVAVSDSNDIPKQVRRWSASYASFIERLKANRAPAGQPNPGNP